MNQNYDTLKWFLHTALSYLGKPYIWGGDDPSGFDCSGFVIECLKTIGYLKETDDFTANELLNHFSKNSILQTAKPGSLLFYLNNENKAFHVVICLDSHFQIGASGGNSKTISTENAWRQNAYIKIRPIPMMTSKHQIIELV